MATDTTASQLRNPLRSCVTNVRDIESSQIGLDMASTLLVRLEALEIEVSGLRSTVALQHSAITRLVCR
jgi:hypothetical protein